LATVESWLLLAVGVIFATIAAFDGYRIEDPYPGYGRLWRRLENARDEYAEEKESLKSQLSDLRDSVIEDLDDARDRVMQREEELNDLASMAEMIRARFNAHLSLLERTCNVVLSKYRQINQGVRSTPPPMYFRQNYTFSSSLNLVLPDTITTDEVNKRKYGITSVLELIDAQRNDVQSSYTEDLTSIDEAIQTLEYGA
jgi:DNA repair exonuclease SbcCD ATPase subunit